MKIAIRAFAVLCLFNVGIGIVSTQLITNTSCAAFNTTPMEPFDKTAYAGIWTMHQFYDWPNSRQYDCYFSIRTLNRDGNHNNTEILINPGLKPEINTGVSIFDQPGKGHWVYSTLTGDVGTGQYDIISTDYDNYAIEWSCTPVSAGNRCFLFVMSRTPIVTDDIQKKIDAIIDEHKFDRTKLRTLDITSCPVALLKGALSGGLNGGLIGGLVNVIGGLLNVILGLVNVILGVIRGLLG